MFLRGVLCRFEDDVVIGNQAGGIGAADVAALYMDVAVCACARGDDVDFFAGHIAGNGFGAFAVGFLFGLG